jgi:hypothetical protein
MSATIAIEGLESVPHITIGAIDPPGSQRAVGIPTTIPGLVLTYTHMDVWTITHVESGLLLVNAGNNLRKAIRLLAHFTDVDWTRSKDEMRADPAAKAAVQAAIAEAYS